MVMTGIAVLIVLAVGYVWLTRGFFSALIHLICTLIAGAIAFGVWEPLSMALLNAAAPGGFTSFLGGTAWAMGLALPFAASLALLRLGVDRLLPANVSPGTISDYAGGGVCGALSGVITAGIVVISLGFLRMESTFFGATHITYDNNGNIVRENAMLVPLDKITAGFYGRLSEAAFKVPEPLARWHPNLQEEGAALRLNFGEGKARNTTKPEDFEVVERFTVGGGQTKFNTLIAKDMFSPTDQLAVDPDGKPFPPDTRIEGLVINFKAGAKEKEGKFAIGASQIRLLLESPRTGERTEVYPIAVWSQAESAGAGWGRWRYDARDTFIAAVGAGAAAQFAFEFPGPADYNPIAVYVKGTRVRLDEGALSQPKHKLASAANRLRYIEGVSGSKPAMPAGTDPNAGMSVTDDQRMPTEGLDLKDAVKIGNGQAVAAGSNVPTPDGVWINNGIGFTVQKGTHDPLVLDESNSKEKYITEGTKDFDSNYKSQTVGLERSLRIEKFYVPSDVVIFKVDVDSASRLSILTAAASAVDRSAAPLLYDTMGNTYQPVGFVYEDSTRLTVRYTPGQPIQSLSDMPSLSRSRPDQKLTLIFQVSLGVSVQAFGIGKKILYEFDPPLPCRTRQNRD